MWYVQAAKSRSPVPMTEKLIAQPETQKAQTAQTSQETGTEAPSEGPLVAWNLAQSPGKGAEHYGPEEYPHVSAY